jgi:hypothetical protein
MTTQPKSNQAKYANLNLNAALTSKTGGQAQPTGLAQGASTLTKGGFLVLSKVCEAMSRSPRLVFKIAQDLAALRQLPALRMDHLLFLLHAAPKGYCRRQAFCS